MHCSTPSPFVVALFVAGTVGALPARAAQEGPGEASKQESPAKKKSADAAGKLQDSIKVVGVIDTESERRVSVAVLKDVRSGKTTHLKLGTALPGFAAYRFTRVEGRKVIVEGPSGEVSLSWQQKKVAQADSGYGSSASQPHAPVPMNSPNRGAPDRPDPAADHNRQPSPDVPESAVEDSRSSGGAKRPEDSRGFEKGRRPENPARKDPPRRGEDRRDPRGPAARAPQGPDEMERDSRVAPKTVPPRP